ncbi:MAG TPA: acylphosphatase [Syntrophales bacterium]|nr:acylphosphatase [Syntrophales bacterium]
MTTHQDSNTTESEQNSNNPLPRRVHVFVTGRVQGVFFRAETKKQASGFGLAGWVRNLDDNRVEALFEGKGSDIDKILDWCRMGPRLAHVSDIEIIEEEPEGNMGDFRIIY